jgi:hypothetical protein
MEGTEISGETEDLLGPLGPLAEEIGTLVTVLEEKAKYLVPTVGN